MDELPARQRAPGLPARRWALIAALPWLLMGVYGCAEILGIETFEERYRDAGEAGVGGQGGVGGSIPAVGWSRRFGDPLLQYARAVAQDSHGNVLLAGDLQGTVSFDGHTLEAAGGEDHDGFVVELDPLGQTLWAQGLAGSLTSTVESLAVTALDEVIAVGHFMGDLDLDGHPHSASAFFDMVVVKYGPDGQHLWSQRFGNNGNQYAYDVALDDSTGEIVLAGRFGTRVDLSPSVNMVAAGNHDALVAKLDSHGTPLWARQFGDEQLQYARAVAVDGNGHIFVTGLFQGAVTFDGFETQALGTEVHDIFLAKLSPQGDDEWGRGFPSSDADDVQDVAVDSQGNVIIGGSFTDTINFSQDPEDQLTSAGAADLFLAKFDSNGTHLWSKRFGGSDDHQRFRALAVDSSDRVIAVGRFVGSVDFGNRALNCGGGHDTVVLWLAADGNHLRSQCYGSAGSTIPSSVALASPAGILLAGWFDDTVDFEYGPMQSAGSDAGAADLFVVKLVPPQALP